MFNRSIENKNGVYAYIDISAKYPEIVYVGITMQTFKERNRTHRQRKENRFFDNYLKKNPNRYKMVLIDEIYVDSKDLNNKEKYYINFFQAYWYDYKKGFNLTKGGSAFNLSPQENSIRQKRRWDKNPQMKKEYSKRMKNLYKNIDNRIIRSQGVTGVLNVIVHKDKKAKNGFYWRYQFRENNKTKSLTNKNLLALKKRVLDKKMDWVIIDSERYKKTLKINNLYLLLNEIQSLKIQER